MWMLLAYIMGIKQNKPPGILTSVNLVPASRSRCHFQPFRAVTMHKKDVILARIHGNETIPQKKKNYLQYSPIGCKKEFSNSDT